MKNAVWVSLSLVMVALAGCAEEPEPLTADDCLVQGLILDPAVEYVDNETGETYLAPGCVEDIPTVTVELQGVTDGMTMSAWNSIDLTWVMRTTEEKDHSHNNGVRISKTSDPAYLGKVDGYGQGLLNGKEEHRDFVDGDSSTVTWTPEDPGSYYVRAYAVSSWGNFWGPEFEVIVEEVQPTGVNHNVAISGGGIPGGATSLNPATLDIALGDSVTWTSDEPLTWEISRKRGPEKADRFSVTTDEALVFTVPGTYTYVVRNDEVGQDEAAEGTINVAFPE